MIDLKNVSYSYGKSKALDNISLKINKGEAVALVGPNGSGKSTLMKMINGIVFPEQGIYRFDGEEINAGRLRDTKFSKLFHQRVGFVFQNSDVQLFCSDVYEEIAFGPRQMGLSQEEVEKRVDDCLKMLSIEELKHRTPYHLSGGEKKKVSIASILAMNPDVFVLDEPTNGLDPKAQRWLVELLVELNRAGKTLITSTHNLELIQVISQRSILFDESHRIAADLQTEALLENVGLLKTVNLVDDYYHSHCGSAHKHFHIHSYSL